MRRTLLLSIIITILSLVITGCAPSLSSVTSEARVETGKTGVHLTVTQPTDGSIISTDRVEVRGSTSPGAVVSVNGEVMVADTEGNFAITISLEEGPNIIEVIASDEEGNEAAIGLTITLVKGGER
jgi:hypothetical protein